MLDQVLQARVDQQMMALMGAIRSAVSGNTGLSQGQTAMAVVQVLQNAAPQNQNPGGGSAGTGAQTSQGGGQNPAAPAQQTQAQVKTTQQAATQATTGQTAATPLPAQTAAPGSTAMTPAAAQALINQVNAQTAAALMAALANGAAGSTGRGQPPANLAQLAQNLSAGQLSGAAPSGAQAAAPGAGGATNPVASNTALAANLTQAHQAAANSAATAANTNTATTAMNTLASSTQPVRVMIPQTGQTVELTQIKPLPAGTQVMLRQSGAAQVDILKVQLPQNPAQTQNSQTAQASTHSTPLANAAALEKAAQKAALQQTAMTALRESLPQQKPVTETLGRIQALLPQLSSIVRDSPLMQQALQTLDKATLKLGSEAAPSAQAVKQAVQRSGVFHEAVVMQALQQAVTAPQGAPIAAVGDDLKGAFFQIFRQLTRSGGQAEGGKESSASSRGGTEAADGKQNSQNQLVRSLQEGLARVRSNQLQSSPATRGAEPGAGGQAIQTDLPIMFNHQLSEVKVKVEQEIWPEDQQLEPGEDYQRRWVINLSFSPPELGQLHARLLYQGEKLSTHLWVEQDEHLPNISKQLHGLKERLSALGIVIDEVRCQAGTPDQKPASGLLSLKA